MQHAEIDDAVARAEERTSELREMRVFLVLFWISALVPLAVQTAVRADRLVLQWSVMGVVAVWLHLVHQVHDRGARRWSPARSIGFLFGLYVALVVLLWLGEAYMWMLFGVYTLTFGYSGSFLNGLLLSLIPTAAWAWSWLYYGFPVSTLATPAFVWVTSNAIAYFTHEVFAQNEERGRLLGEVARARDALAVSERRRGTLEERARMAGEIHDTLAQGFTSVVLLAKGMSSRVDELSTDDLRTNLEMIERTARDNLAEARRLVEALRPVVLDDASLADAVRRIAARHEADTSTRVVVDVVGVIRSLGGSEEILLLRAVQEALSNARKHASATVIRIVLTFDAKGVFIEVLDDGVGFTVGAAPSAVAGETGGQGLDILRDRIESAGGEVVVDSRPGQGTQFSARVPARPHHTEPEPA